MPFRIVLTLTAIVSLSCLPAPAWAADEASPAPKRGPQAEEFYRLNAEMNTLLADLASLQLKYRKATEDQRTEIQQQWKALVAKGEKLEPKLIAAAERAYAEAPNADKQVTDFLVTRQLARMVHRDDYERAAEIGKLLMDHNCPDPRVPNLAGIAAFAVSDFDAAEKYLTAAEEHGYYKKAAKDDRVAMTGQAYLKLVPEYKLKWAKEKQIRQAEAKADDLPRVLLKTSKGDIVIELFENEAPNTVANFVSLVERGFYKNIDFHRVLPGFMAQGGDPKGNGSGGPGYNIACECYKPNHREHFRGSLSMAKEGRGGSDGKGRDTGGSQFFLCFVPTAPLDGNYTVFGRVIEGLDVLAKIQRRDPEDPEALRPDKIIEAKVLRKRPHEYKPEKMPE
jgi:cyclophilin family peptidyl-prolyl cis-trans isomerase